MRTVLCSVAVLALFLGGLMADEKKAAKEGKNYHKATFVKADLDKKTITFKTKDKEGKEVEMTLPLAKDAKVFGEKSEGETLEKLVKNLEKDKDKTIIVLEDKEQKHIVEIKDAPPQEVAAEESPGPLAEDTTRRGRPDQ